VFGAKVQNGSNGGRPLERRTHRLLSLLPLGRFRFYTVTGNFPHRAAARTRCR
jgi:hypothetical protein